MTPVSARLLWTCGGLFAAGAVALDAWFALTADVGYNVNFELHIIAAYACFARAAELRG